MPYFCNILYTSPLSGLVRFTAFRIPSIAIRVLGHSVVLCPGEVQLYYFFLFTCLQYKDAVNDSDCVELKGRKFSQCVT